MKGTPVSKATGTEPMVEGSHTEDGFDLYFGPVHPGSGNFGVKLTVRGEEIMGARADPGYLHRGFEKLMEYRTPMQNAVLSDRLCILESLNWNLVHAEAVDRLRGTEIPDRAKYIRVIMAELSRIQSHIIWYGVLSKAVGFETGFMVAFGYRDYVLDLFEFVTGGRVYPAGYICPGGVRRDFPEGTKKRIRELLVKMETMVGEFEAYDSSTIKARVKGTGTLKLDDAIRLGATGPVLRASGLAADVRRDAPYEVYDELDFEIPVCEEGDAYARSTIRRREIEESIKIVRQALDRLPNEELPPVKPKVVSKIPEGEVYVRNEIARGEAAVYMKSVGESHPYRCKIRGPDLLHMIPVLEHLLVGAEVADVPAIYWSLNICPADMDR
jgi:NADH-quinone oxidoreductase subunit D